MVLKSTYQVIIISINRILLQKYLKHLKINTEKIYQVVLIV
jgi:hypothetical protein